NTVYPGLTNCATPQVLTPATIAPSTAEIDCTAISQSLPQRLSTSSNNRGWALDLDGYLCFRYPQFPPCSWKTAGHPEGLAFIVASNHSRSAPRVQSPAGGCTSWVLYC